MQLFSFKLSKLERKREQALTWARECKMMSYYGITHHIGRATTQHHTLDAKESKSGLEKATLDLAGGESSTSVHG